MNETDIPDSPITPSPVVWEAEDNDNMMTVVIPAIVIVVVVIVLGCCCVRHEKKATKRQKAMFRRRRDDSDEETGGGGAGEEERIVERQVQMEDKEKRKKRREKKAEKEKEKRTEEVPQVHEVSPQFAPAEDPMQDEEAYPLPVPENPVLGDEDETREYRQDPEDGRHYDLQSFFEVYGEEQGLERWEMVADTAIFPTVAQITEQEAAAAIQEDFP